MKHLFCSLFLGLLVSPALAQMDYPRAFIKKLKKSNLAFYEPAEGRFRSFKLARNIVFRPDFAMESRLNQLEVLYAIRKNKDQSLNLIPHIQGQNLAYTLTSNEGDSEIVVEFYSDKLLEEKKLDWAARFDFVPKEILTTKTYGTLIALQRAESNASAYLVFFYNDPEMDFSHYFDTLQFEQE